jgi:alkylation response protein AidB-like acyl-CoA dehydrogenase
METYNLEYWREEDETKELPEEMWDVLVDAGFVGMEML